MLFVWMGFLKSNEPISQDVQHHITDFLQQPLIAISSAGVLRGPGGERSGYLVVFEADDRAAAEALVRESPVRDAGLYSEYHLFEYQNEVG